MLSMVFYLFNGFPRYSFNKYKQKLTRNVSNSWNHKHIYKVDKFDQSKINYDENKYEISQNGCIKWERKRLFWLDFHFNWKFNCGTVKSYIASLNMTAKSENIFISMIRCFWAHLPNAKYKNNVWRADGWVLLMVSPSCDPISIYI